MGLSLCVRSIQSSQHSEPPSPSLTFPLAAGIAFGPSADPLLPPSTATPPEAMPLLRLHLQVPADAGLPAADPNWRIRLLIEVLRHESEAALPAGATSLFPTARRRLPPALPTISGDDIEEEEEGEAVLLPRPPAEGHPAAEPSPGHFHRRSLSRGIGDLFGKLGIHIKAKPGPASGTLAGKWHEKPNP